MPTNEKDPKSPATTSDAYDRMSPRWHVIESLLGGTETMRAAAQAYLPQHAEETDDGYQERLQQATLFNATKKTLEDLVGKPFSKPLKPNDDVPKQFIEGLFKDIDLMGNDVNVFVQEWFREGLAKSFAHVLIDFPKVEPRQDGLPRTKEDDAKDGMRPYWNLIKPECLIFAAAETRGGQEVLTHVRIMEHYTVRDGFAEVCKKRIRVLEPGTVTLYELNEKNKQREEWVKTDSWNTGLSYIPLVTFYAHRETFMVGQPPLLDLAWLNVSHWQSVADQRHILKVSRFPILYASGVDGDESKLVIGPNKVWYVPEANGKVGYIEHTGSAIEAGRQDIQDLEAQMATYGAQFLQDKPGDQTATGRALDSAEASCDLARMVGVFEDAIAKALAYTAEWSKVGKEGGTVQLVREYDMQESNPADLTALQAARASRDISRDAYLRELMLRHVLSEEYDPEADLALIQEEATTAIGAAQGELDPAAPPDVPPTDPKPKGDGKGDGKTPPKKPGAK